MLPEISKKFPSLREKMMKPFLINVNPNYITVLALLAAIAAGYFAYMQDFIAFGILVLLNGFLDIWDGEIAKQFKRETKFGDFLDHAFDRLADVAILLGLTLTPYVPDWLGYITIIAVLLVSYLGTEAQALTSHRLYAAWLGRSDRLVIIAAAAFLQMWFASALYYGFLLILLMSAISFLQRFFVITRVLGKK